MQAIEILLVEDDEVDAAFIQRTLAKNLPATGSSTTFTITHRTSLSSSLEFLKANDVGVILLDLSLPDSSRGDTFQRVHDASSHLPIIVFTGLGDEDMGMSLVHQGAQDYLVKGEVSGPLLIRSIQYAIQRKYSQNEVARYRDHLEELVKARTAQLEASQHQLRQSERLASIGALAAGIAHEINNPIGVILLAAENALHAKDEVKPDVLLEQTCHKVIANARRCGQIVKGVLLFARQQSAERSPNNINAIIKDAVRHFVDQKRETEENRQLISLQLAEDLPAVIVNPVEIEQVFVNLIQNSLQSRSGKIHIELTTAVADGVVVTTVTDDGPGIPESLSARIFDPFFTTRQQNGGTGLGLSIVHGIITAHGGTIDVTSREREGTTITFRLPSIPSAAGELPTGE